MIFFPISGMNRPDISQSGSNAHLNVQLGPLQVWPYYNNGESKFFRLFFNIFQYISNAWHYLGGRNSCREKLELVI